MGEFGSKMDKCEWIQASRIAAARQESPLCRLPLDTVSVFRHTRALEEESGSRLSQSLTDD